MRERFHPNYGPRSRGQVHLVGFTDRGFEQFVYDEILRGLANQEGALRGCSVDLTPRSADRGRDISITNCVERTILGFQYPQPQPQTIVAECKLVGGQRLNFEHVAANVLQLVGARSASFLLITNATLTPRSLALIQDHCERMGLRFQLIDAYNFDRHFPSLRENAENIPNRDDALSVPSSVELQVSYQALPNLKPDGPGFTIHVVVRSFGPGSVNVGVALHSTRDWNSLGTTQEVRRLDGDDLHCFSIRIAPRGARLKDSARLALAIDSKPSLFDVRLSGNDDLIDLPLFGTSMVLAVDKYDSQLRSGIAPRVLHLHGPSGTGKTRFLLEIARRVGFTGRDIVWFRLRDDGTAVVRAPASATRSKQLGQTVTQPEMLRRVRSALASDSRSILIIIDDLHVGSDGTLDAIEEITFDPPKHPKLILSGRSDPLIRQARYEAFARLVSENGRVPRQEQVVLGDFDGDSIATIISSFLPGQATAALSTLAQKASIRPVELVHYIHSLLERGFLAWIDENRLCVVDERASDTNGSVFTSVFASQILDYRFEYLDGVQLGDFSLADVFTLLALIDKPELTFAVLERLRVESGLPDPLSTYWFDTGDAPGMAFVAHDTIKEFLTKRFYRFDKPKTFAGALRSFPEVNAQMGALPRAAVRLHSRDFSGAVPPMAKLARDLRTVKNISSLALDQLVYDDLASLVFLLNNKKRRCPKVLCQALIARAYLNIHCREFVDGLVDCLELLSIVEGLGKSGTVPLMRLAVRQLMAHGLLNSGDLRTAITLMHQVENEIHEMNSSQIALAVEFDMCDRLQSYYMQQSAFELARSFLFRGRAKAYRSKDEALINISLSGEFHLHRYLDTEEALRMAVRQRRHADDHAPLRLKLHAETNEAVAQWARHGPVAPDRVLETIENVHIASVRAGFGHLVPRIDYLKAVNAYHRLDRGDGAAAEFIALALTTQRSAVRYGYSEYTWLSENLQLLYRIGRGDDAAAVESIANRIIDELARNGLTFVAEEYLCYQNVVAISNALRALYTFTDESTAWKVAEKISFSPLISSTKADRERRLRAVFAGGLLCPSYDSRAVSNNRQGYFTILV